MNNGIHKLLIVGGGSAGWMAAALLSRMLPKLSISLVESPLVGTIGVGEASIPPLTHFNQLLGISEAEFIAATQGSYKLGIEFENWGAKGERYMHAFGSIGKSLGATDFHQLWLRQQAAGDSTDFWRYSLNYQAAKANRFSPNAQLQGSPLAPLVHAYHFDAGLYAQMLRRYSENKGVNRIEGHITQVMQQDGRIASVVLDSGQTLSADFFIDCTGLAALLIGKTLATEFEDWGHFLPCDRAIAVPTQRTEPLQPYTRSIAHEAGWQWRIPLQHRTGNGMVYCSEYWSEDEATARLLANLDAPILAEPRLIKFRTGRRQQQWQQNCLALGLASGFLEPLESTSIHLIHSGLVRFIRLFPTDMDGGACREEYNRQSRAEFEQIRDFIILHYHLNRSRHGHSSAFWQHCATMDIPASLKHKLDLFAQGGQVFRHQDELFSEAAWQQVFLGQGLLPAHYHPMADTPAAADLSQYLKDMGKVVDATVAAMPSHTDFLRSLAR
ncbi:tryptophan halogenase family protein [Shewanella cyperi]|uniref:tryptophan halogenase family protein n=1 Tax=Shewanella cyperi TaxID=2814292 RepID=UPI001A9417FA|nr:tryptophan halogenase family protein [Shewanella cyperi]QSX39276.1 tryptophan 7-halogenase [Shewanella cyperi]